MPQQTTSLATVYTGWDNYQELLVKAITPLSAEQLTLRIAPHLRSAGELATHILAVRARWFRQVLHEGDENIAKLENWDRPEMPVRTTPELVYGLELSWQMIQERLARWNTDDLAQLFEEIYKGETFSLTLQWVIWHLIEHDMHHGGELSFLLGMHGLEAVNI